MRDEGYETKTVHYFVASGERWQVVDFSEIAIELEETSKNGQEDCHVSVCANLVDDHWEVDGESREDLRRYMYDFTADEIEAFLNEYGVPGS